MVQPEILAGGHKDKTKNGGNPKRLTHICAARALLCRFRALHLGSGRGPPYWSDPRTLLMKRKAFREYINKY